MKKAKNKQIRILSDLVARGCLPKWYTFDAGVYDRESIIWCQPGRPYMKEKIRWINLQNLPVTHNVESANNPGNLKPDIAAGVLPDDFDIQDVPFATPADWYNRNKKQCDELGFPEPNCSLQIQIQEPEPEVIEVADDDNSYASSLLVIDQDVASEDDSDEDWDSGLKNSLNGSKAMETDSDAGAERLDLWDDVMDPKDQVLFDIRQWMRCNPVRTPPPIPEYNNNNNPLLLFKEEKFRFNFENPPRPEDAEVPLPPHDRSPIPPENICTYRQDLKGTFYLGMWHLRISLNNSGSEFNMKNYFMTNERIWPKSRRP